MNELPNSISVARCAIALCAVSFGGYFGMRGTAVEDTMRCLCHQAGGSKRVYDTLG